MSYSLKSKVLCGGGKSEGTEYRTEPNVSKLPPRSLYSQLYISIVEQTSTEVCVMRRAGRSI